MVPSQKDKKEIKVGVVNVNLEYKIPENYDGTPEEYLENVELPKEYVSESFEIIKIIVEDEHGNLLREE